MLVEKGTLAMIGLTPSLIFFLCVLCVFV